MCVLEYVMVDGRLLLSYPAEGVKYEEGIRRITERNMVPKILILLLAALATNLFGNDL